MTPDDDLVAPRPAGADPARARVSGPASPGAFAFLTDQIVLDAAAAADLRRETRALLARSGDPIVVDLTDVRDVEPTVAPARSVTWPTRPATRTSISASSGGRAPRR